MKRTTIFLDEAVESDLQALARGEARSVASLVREALAEYIATRQPGFPSTPGFVAVGASGRGDVAERHEELLWRDEVVSSRPAPHPAPVRSTRKRR